MKTKTPQVNPTCASILGLLHEAPMTGSDINRMAQEWLAPYWSMTRSQVYRELDAMEERGYVRAGTPGSRGATPFRITAAGKKAFQRWLNESPGEDILRSQVALRLAFGGLHRGDALHDMVEWAKDHHERALAEVKELIKRAEEEEMPYDVAALHFSKVYHQGNLAWLNSVELSPAED